MAAGGLSAEEREALVRAFQRSASFPAIVAEEGSDSNQSRLAFNRSLLANVPPSALLACKTSDDLKTAVKVFKDADRKTLFAAIEKLRAQHNEVCALPLAIGPARIAGRASRV
jgi:hypothetical protein